MKTTLVTVTVDNDHKTTLVSFPDPLLKQGYPDILTLAFVTGSISMGYSTDKTGASQSEKKILTDSCITLHHSQA